MFFERQQERHHEPKLTTQRSFTPLVTQGNFLPIMPTQPLTISLKDNPM